VLIRPAAPRDADAIWAIFRRVVAGRDTYAFHPDTSRDEGVGYWFGEGITSFVVDIDGHVVGMYKLIANHRGLGAHVSNASFMVDPAVSGRGIGRVMGEHCLYQARLQGYEAMQFNFVVSTNAHAVRLWQSLGFEIVGTLPKAFQHGALGLVDAYVMHRSLGDVIPIFGEERRTIDAKVRDCAYVVLSTSTTKRQTQIALVKARDDMLLPGGGLDPGEDHTHAAIREAEEECALRVAVRQVLGNAIQFVGGRAGQPVFEKRSRFFTAAIEHPVPRRPDHEVIWLPPDEAAHASTNDSHRWAVRRWQRLNT